MFHQQIFVVAATLVTKLKPGMLNDLIGSVRAKFIEYREKIVKCSKPWTPWALVELFDIDDSKQTIPAELILYRALCKQTRLAHPRADEIMQVQLGSHIF